MAQQKDGGSISVANEYEQYDFDEIFVTSTSYAVALRVDAMKIRESTIQFTNKGTAILSYKIFGSARKGQKLSSINPETNDAWINLLSTGTYDHTTETDIPASVSATGTVTAASVTGEVHASGTVTCVSAIATDTVTVNGLLYTAVAGAKADNTEFSIDTGNNETATDLADSINNDTRIGTLNDLTATSSTNVVTAVQTVGGTGGNATTLVSSNGVRLAVSGATFAGGINGDTVTLNGIVYTATVGTKADNTEFSVDTSNDATATDLADSITNDTRIGTDVTTIDQTATSSTDTVTITASETGAEANSIGLASSNGTRLAVSAATLTGGVGTRAFETFSNPWRYVIVMIKAASGTPTLKIWHRGEN